MRGGRFREMIAHGSSTVSVFRPVKTEVRPKSANCAPKAKTATVPATFIWELPAPALPQETLVKKVRFKPPVPLLEIPNSGSSIVCTLMVNKPLN